MPVIGLENGQVRGRRVVFTIGQEGEKSASYEGDTLTTNGFDIDFTVSYNTDGPPTASITLWNPSREVVQGLRTGRAVVTLAAGYGVPGRLFAGSPTPKVGLSYKRQGADRALKIECKDGLKAFAETRARVGLSGPTSYNAAIAEVCRSVGLSVGVTQIDPSLIFPSGFYAHDAPDATFNRIAASSLTTWYVEDGTVHFIYLDEPTEAAEGPQVPLYSAEDGSLTEVDWKEDGMSIKAPLVDPSMRPGKPFVVRCEDAFGEVGRFTQVAREVSFSGSSRSGDFSVSISSGSKKEASGRPKTYKGGGPK